MKKNTLIRKSNFTCLFKIGGSTYISQVKQSSLDQRHQQFFYHPNHFSTRTVAESSENSWSFVTTSYSVQRCLLKYSNFIVNYRSKKNIFKSKFWEIIRTCSSTKHSFQACFYCFKVWALWWTIHPAWFHESAITLVFAIILENFRAEGRFKSCPYTLDNVCVNVKRKNRWDWWWQFFFF